jgi:hypothetical protein
MFRNPFVWEVQVRREIIEDEIVRLRDLPYTLWRELLTRPMSKMAKGRDERTYRIKTNANWAHDGSEDIRVEVALESPTLHRRLISQSFVITPDNQFIE